MEERGARDVEARRGRETGVSQPVASDHAERSRRATFFREAAAMTPAVAVDTRHGRFLVSTADEVVGRSLFVKRARSEMATLRRALRVLRELGRDPRTNGRALLDVGANIGTTTVSALVRGGFARAIAIEPAPANLKLLRANLALNGLDDRARVLALAASDHQGWVRLALHATNSGDHRVAAAGTEAGRDQVKVRCSSLDAMVAAGEFRADDVGLLWVDAQGHEPMVLAGAETLLDAGVPAVVELWPAALRSSQTLGLLQDVVCRHYTHLIVLGAPEAERSPRPVSALDALASAQGDGFTDLLLLGSDERAA